MEGGAPTKRRPSFQPLERIQEESDEEDIDPADLVCRICCGQAKRPVQLSCEHIFCWTCLVSASSWHAESCPSCHMPHSMRPEDIKDRVMTFRKTYQSWRAGKAHGARGQVRDLYSGKSPAPKEIVVPRDAKQGRFRVAPPALDASTFAISKAPALSSSPSSQYPISVGGPSSSVAPVAPGAGVGVSSVDPSNLVPPPRQTLAAATQLNKPPPWVPPSAAPRVVAYATGRDAAPMSAPGCVSCTALTDVNMGEEGASSAAINNKFKVAHVRPKPGPSMPGSKGGKGVGKRPPNLHARDGNAGRGVNPFMVGKPTAGGLRVNTEMIIPQQQPFGSSPKLSPKDNREDKPPS